MQANEMNMCAAASKSYDACGEDEKVELEAASSSGKTESNINSDRSSIERSANERAPTFRDRRRIQASDDSASVASTAISADDSLRPGAVFVGGATSPGLNAPTPHMEDDTYLTVSSPLENSSDSFPVLLEAELVASVAPVEPLGEGVVVGADESKEGSQVGDSNRWKLFSFLAALLFIAMLLVVILISVSPDPLTTTQPSEQVTPPPTSALTTAPQTSPPTTAPEVPPELTPGQSRVPTTSRFLQQIHVKNNRIFTSGELDLIQVLYGTYTMRFAPGEDLAQDIQSSCSVTKQDPQTFLGGSNHPGRILQALEIQLTFQMDYSSTSRNVTNFPLLFQNHVNSNLDTVALQMRILALNVSRVGSATRIPTATSQPTTQPTQEDDDSEDPIDPPVEAPPNPPVPAMPSSSSPVSSPIASPVTTSLPTPSPSGPPIPRPTSSPSIEGIPFLPTTGQPVMPSPPTPPGSPVTAPEPTALPTEIRSPTPTLSLPSEGFSIFSQSFRVGNGSIFAPDEVSLIQALYRSYTINFAQPQDIAQGRLATDCVVTRQEPKIFRFLLGAPNQLGRNLQPLEVHLTFEISYTSVYINVTQFPSFFQGYVNDNLGTVSTQMRLLGLNVTNVGTIIAA